MIKGPQPEEGAGGMCGSDSETVCVREREIERGSDKVCARERQSERE